LLLEYCSAGDGGLFSGGSADSLVFADTYGKASRDMRPIITIGSSAQGDLPAKVAAQGQEEDQAPSEDKKRIPVAWIAATLGIGLLIAAIYLGGRILTANRSSPPASARLATAASVKPAASAQPPDALPPPPAVPEPAAEPATASADDSIPMITPREGELYIQVGALDPDATRRFVQRLRSEKRDPHVAVGPAPELMRVLIGPFDNPDALNEQKAQLQSEGIDTFVRQY
jgi:cell division septation protein DedD